jgi:hypothetical protein
VVRYAAGQHKAEQNSKLYTAIESALDRVTGSGPGLETVDTAKKVLFNIQRQICSFSTVSLVEVARAILGEDDFMITEKDTNFVSWKAIVKAAKEECHFEGSAPPQLVAPNAAGSSSAVAAPPQIQSRRKKAIERSHISVGTNGSFCLADSLQDWWLRPPELRHYSRFEVGYPFQDGHPQVGSHLLTRCECQALPVFLGLNLTQPQKSAEAHAFELLLMLKPGVHCQGPDGPSMRQQLLDGCATFAEAKDKLMKEISQADPQSLQAQISRNFMSMLNMHDEAEKAKQKRDNEAREALQREGSREEIPQEEGVGEDSDTGKQPDVAEQAELERIRQLLAVEEEHNPTSMEEEEKAVSSARVRIVQGLEAFQRAGGLQGLEHSPTVTGQPQPQPQPQPQVPGSSSLPRGFN